MFASKLIKNEVSSQPPPWERELSGFCNRLINNGIYPLSHGEGWGEASKQNVL